MAKRVRGLYKRGKVWWCCYKDINERVVRASTGTSVYDNAIDFLMNRRKEVKAGIEPEQKKIVNHTFNELTEEYKKWCERQKSYYSKIHLINQLKDKFGHIPLRRFNTMLIEQFQTERIKQGIWHEKHQDKLKGNKPATVNRLIATLSHMFTKAVEWDMVEEETLKRIRKVKQLKENNRRLRYLSKEECQALINACDNHVKPIVISALNTGCRKGEILSLKWDNVDLKHGFILLDRTKNGDRREIPINDTLKKTIQGITRRLDIPYVFFDSVTGLPYKNVKRSFNSALKKAGIRDFHFHDCRHTFASHLVMAGVDLTTVSRLLGHKSLTMTLRYSHLAPSHMVNALGILDNVLNDNATSQSVHNKAVNG